MADQGSNKTSGRDVPRDQSPPSNFERGAADADIDITRDKPGEVDPYERGDIGEGPGAGDASSGGGAGAGIPGGGTDMRTNGRFDGGDVQKDKKKLFPEPANQAAPRGKTSEVKPKDQPAPKGL